LGLHQNTPSISFIFPPLPTDAMDLCLLTNLLWEITGSFLEFSLLIFSQVPAVSVPFSPRRWIIRKYLFLRPFPISLTVPPLLPLIRRVGVTHRSEKVPLFQFYLLPRLKNYAPLFSYNRCGLGVHSLVLPAGVSTEHFSEKYPKYHSLSSRSHGIVGRLSNSADGGPSLNLYFDDS